jgi:anhydro-N-acetylmuramic acid kinase
MLARVLKKKTLTIIGLNSGTSADGLDLAAVRIATRRNGMGIKFLAGKSCNYPSGLREAVNRAMSGELSVDRLIDLDRQLGVFYGRRIDHFGAELRKKGIVIDAVASHGQTVRHLPGRIKISGKKRSGTLQLGHPASIAEQTGLVTIADFRQSDIAAGGEGAPITAYAMAQIFGRPREPRLLVNIGGISNYFLIPSGGRAEDIRARDCGPGNSLIDLAARDRFNRRYDRNGALAGKGKSSRRLTSILLADNYLKGKYGPSTGKERFGEKFYKKAFDAARRLRLSRHDFMASLTELTAIAIASTVKPILKKYRLEKMYIFGGGLANKYLMKALARNLQDLGLLSVGTLGYDPDYLEATCYAVMGALTLRLQPNCPAHITGAGHDTIGGCILQPGTAG